ncbi:MAG: response regulator transcription factor [Clostridiales bacterium]|nr:response regulator transcription factor [Eubacteriales bacterium]MDH7567710.1 response regulator transcription factor [Clostridiales bacterium]
MRLLLIEDEVRLSEALAYILKKNNYGIDTAYDGITGLEMAETGIYDLIILDRMLPGKEGLEILKEMRKKGIHTPVIVLTARDAVRDRVEGLDSGADDYLVKPFSTEELLARIRALSRRQGEVLQAGPLVLGSLVFDPLKAEIACGEEAVKLTLKESMILELLMRNKNQVITKDLILDKVWGVGSDIEINNLDVYLSYLRKKMASLNCGVVIETVRGVGYCLKEG